MNFNGSNSDGPAWLEQSLWSLQVSLCIINPGWLELPLARTTVHGPKPVPAIEVLVCIYGIAFLSSCFPVFRGTMKASRQEYAIQNQFYYVSTKTYDVDTQKNLLNPMVLLSTQIMLKLMGKKIHTILC